MDILWKLYGIFIIQSFLYVIIESMRAVKLKQYGGPENMFVDGNVSVPELPSPDYILIRVFATALNRADTLQRKGGYSPPEGETDILGLEASGIVNVVGSNVKEFKVGDQVMALLGGGGYAEYVSVHRYHVMKVPEGIDLSTAAAIPEVWLTAYQLLYFIAKINPGESVLIHAAGSGVGTAAIQLVKAIPGTFVIATAGTTEKLLRAKDLGADVIVNYKEENFQEKVQQETEGFGVNIVLDPVGASNWQKNIESLSVDGRWVLYGLMGGAQIEGNLLAQLLRKRVQLLPTTLRSRSLEYKKNLVDSFKSVLPKFSLKTFIPMIDSITTLDQVVEAHERMEANLNAGKIILKIEETVRDEL